MSAGRTAITPNVMTICWLTASVRGRGDIPIEPLLDIELGVQPSLAVAVSQLPTHVRLIWPGGRYQILNAHTGKPVYTRDDIVDEKEHETFRRLTHHWGWWFLRLRWQGFYTDFQIMQVGGKVFPLQADVEAALNDLNRPREELAAVLSEVLQYPPEEDREAVAWDHIRKYEALVGPLPAHLTVLTAPPGKKVIVDRQRFLDGQITPEEITDQMWATEGQPRFEKVLARPKEVMKDQRQHVPCERCGKDGPRYHYGVRVGQKLHNVCMDCADGLQASEVFKGQPRPAPPAPKKSNHDAVVEHYLEHLRQLSLEAPRKFYTTSTGLPDPEHLYIMTGNEYRLLTARLREARLYELTPDDFHCLLEAAVKYIDASLDTHIATVGYTPSPEECALVVSVAHQVPPPGPLPFPAIYVGWGDGIPFSDQYTQANRDGSRTGWLLCDDGYIFDLDCQDVEDDQQKQVYRRVTIPTVIRRTEGWALNDHRNINFVAPWVATLLVAALNDKQTIVLRQDKAPLRERLAYEKMSKKARQRFLPRPYYTVTISEQVIQDRAKKLPRIVIPREWSHRFDRAAHFRHFIRRGPLPLGDRKRRLLQAGGFSVFTDPSEVTGEAMAVLMRRGVPQMKAGEWLATKKTHVDQQEKIPHARQDLPYVPAVRKPEGPLMPDPTRGSPE
jgi:hypothetical protein